MIMICFGRNRVSPFAGAGDALSRKMRSAAARSRKARPLNLREQHKTDKLRRIKAAARELFIAQGFDATTIRQIADHAGVGLATLFLYAADKRDLLFLTCNDELAALTERAFTDVGHETGLVARLTVAFRHFFLFYAENRTLSRDLLRELTFFTAGQHSARFQATRAATIAKIAETVAQAATEKAIAPAQPPALVAEVIFFVFAAEVRQWLAKETAPPEAGVQRLASMLQVVIEGLHPKK